MTELQKAFHNGENYESCYLFPRPSANERPLADRPITSADISAAARISRKR